MKTSLEAKDVWTQTEGSEIHENVNGIVAEMKLMNSKMNDIEHLLIKVLKVPSYDYIPPLPPPIDCGNNIDISDFSDVHLEAIINDLSPGCPIVTPTRNVLHDKENIFETKNLLLTPNSSKGETTSVEDILKITYKDPPRLARDIARTVFGIQTLRVSTITGRQVRGQKTKVLDMEKLLFVKSLVKSKCTSLSMVEFEVIWGNLLLIYVKRYEKTV